MQVKILLLVRNSEERRVIHSQVKLIVKVLRLHLDLLVDEEVEIRQEFEHKKSSVKNSLKKCEFEASQVWEKAAMVVARH
jgi:hypothetical protein